MYTHIYTYIYIHIYTYTSVFQTLEDACERCRRGYDTEFCNSVCMQNADAVACLYATLKENETQMR